ncbi:hypothetical protein HanHA89_Chr13g0534531 [Helianthus annuus]|nr:hypothetical protein HanHA89_Chr13g0534531 [Helianthus annuus]
MIKQDTLFIPSFPHQETMFVYPEPNPTSDPISDWLEDSTSYIQWESRFEVSVSFFFILDYQ